MGRFVVSRLPDVGGFADGDGAALCWDVLHRTAAHAIPEVIDLTGCVHFKPYALACLCGLGELGRRSGRPVQVIRPTDAKLNGHLARIGFPAFFATDWEQQEARDTNLCVTLVQWPPASQGERVIEVLAPRCDLPPGVFPQMVAGIDEVILNALTHADSPIDCIVAGQAFPGTDKVEVAVLDLGQTIRGHLAQNPAYADLPSDLAAIQLAVQDGVTGTPPGQRNWRGDPNSGAGLANLKDYCEVGGGELTVLSGSHWMTYRPDQGPVTGRIRTRFHGCLVNIRYFTGSALQNKAVEAIL